MKYGIASMLLIGALFAALPSSSNYQLHNYGYGSGGTGQSTSTNYGLNATTGETSNAQSSSANYKIRSGDNNFQQANVPVAPTFTNPSNYYNKLRFVIATSNNPSDTKYSIAISTDNFATTQYVKSDNTVGTTLAITDYQTYAAWGGASGGLVVGLAPSTTYKIKVNSFQGKYTQTEYGPTATATTVAPSVTFDINVAATDITTSPPYVTSFGSLLPAVTTNTPEKIWVSVITNGEAGAKVYISSTNSGLRSSTANFTITSTSVDLSAAATGYGAQGSSATQASGGPLTISAPYNVSTQIVGILDATVREIFSTPSPIAAGRGSFQLKAKAAALTPAAGDYKDTLTLTIASAF